MAFHIGTVLIETKGTAGMKKMSVIAGILSVGLTTGLTAAVGDVAVETDSFRLVIGADAVAKSLVVKATGEECLDTRDHIPLFAVTQDRPFNNERKLIHPNKKTVYPACKLRREGDSLVVGFSHELYEARVALRIAEGYIAFTLEDFPIDRKKSYDYLVMDIPPVASFRVLQLPVKNRKYFGDWLNASWDEKNAVAVVGTSPYPDVDHEERTGYRTLNADLVAGIKLRGAGAALIAAAGKEKFLDAMDALEKDFGLPRGVESRRGAASKSSIFHLSSGFSPAQADTFIAYAKKGGFRLMTFNYSNVVRERGSWRLCGDYDWREDLFPNKEADLKSLLSKIKAAGITPGLHTLHSHIGLESRYVTPVADPRLNKTRRFTLAQAMPPDTNDVVEIAVQEPTADAPLYKPCRVLQFGGELLSYENYTTEPPYKFLGVKRGVWKTTPQPHEKGQIGGVLDISEFGSPGSCYLDQNSDLQEEVGAKLANIYNCGFGYLYLDGSEGVNRPFNFHVANGQYRFWKMLRPEPLFGEGAAKTHFGWHMLAGANAFDCFSPEEFKEKLREFPFKQAPITWQDMTRVDFGWWGFWAPTAKSVGTQPDMWEYGASVAAAWDCAMSILMPLDQLEKHPRTDDILETLRRWEDVREKNWLTKAQREELKNYEREHHLLINAKGEYELVPYDWIQVGDGKSPIRAFFFGRKGASWVVYWHGSGEGTVKLPFAAKDVELLDEVAGKPVAFETAAGSVVLPAGRRRYLKTDLSRKTVEKAFAGAVVFPETGGSGQ